MNLVVLQHRHKNHQRYTGITMSGCVRVICVTVFFLFSFFVSRVNAQTATISVNDNNVCQNATSPILTFNGSGGTPDYEFDYTVNGGGTQTLGPGDNLQINVPTGSPATITYHLIGVRDNDGAGATVDLDQTIVVTITAAPTPDVEIVSGSMPLCYNGTTDITIRSDITGSDYQWYVTGFPPGPGSPISGADNRNLTVSSSGYYTVRVTNGAGCVGFSAPFQVTQMPTPSPINGSHNTTHETECVGFNPSTINANTSGGASPRSFQWQTSDDGNNWSNIGGATSEDYNPPQLNSSGEYYYRLVITDDCGETFETNPKRITIVDPPTANASSNSPVCEGQTINLTAANAGGGATYHGMGPVEVPITKILQ